MINKALSISLPDETKL